ncbi:hypothetical protein HYT23_02440 [Candidatus Pacearchaeota archaeon]|nr:hypothetical protein [Candidatus Pacearchaeota archaeon]
MKKQKVLVAMSGGVDSSVAALLMKKQGYEVIGAFMKNWSDTKNDFGECTWRGERRMALRVAAMLKIPLITLDFEKEYRKLVVEEMYKKYRQGITPNPDIDCNDKVKFPLLIRAMRKLKCDFLVTGHYARIKKSVIRNKLDNKNNSKVNNKYANVNESISGFDGSNKYTYKLLRAKDEMKDQSYFLYKLKQKELACVQFPIGEYKKEEVREIARRNKFPNYKKKSTVGICFIGKVNLKKFLQKKIKPRPGIIIDPLGNVIGEHDGIFYYTIGQRIGPRFGIEVAKNEKQQKKWYIARKNAKKNVLVAAPEGHELNFREEIYANDIHWISKGLVNELKNNIKNVNNSKSRLLISNGKYASVSEPISEWARGNKPVKVFSRIRQVGELLSSIISFKNNKIKVTLRKPITGVSEGQAIVLYRGKEVLGGGVIGFS